MNVDLNQVASEDVFNTFLKNLLRMTLAENELSEGISANLCIILECRFFLIKFLFSTNCTLYPVILHILYFVADQGTRNLREFLAPFVYHPLIEVEVHLDVLIVCVVDGFDLLLFGIYYLLMNIAINMKVPTILSLDLLIQDGVSV